VIAQFVEFPDHHWFTQADLQSLADAVSRTSARFLVTTEKDAVRLEGHPARTALPLEKTFAMIVGAEVADPAGHLDNALRRIAAGGAS
jgi:tetraacyldisaccharide 4'-kinase